MQTRVRILARRLMPTTPTEVAAKRVQLSCGLSGGSLRARASPVEGATHGSGHGEEPPAAEQQQQRLAATHRSSLQARLLQDLRAGEISDELLPLLPDGCASRTALSFVSVCSALPAAGMG